MEEQNLNKEQCLICGNTFKRKCDLSKHLTKMHSLSSTEYTIKYVLNNVIPKCKCECGNEVKITGYKVNDYYRGHHNPNTQYNGWQTKYDKDSQEYKDIINKISKSVTQYAKENDIVRTDEQRKQMSKSRKKYAKDNPEKIKKATLKMTNTKRKQAKEGILSEQHFTNKLTQEEIDDLYSRISAKASETKRKKKELGIYPDVWNKGLTKDTDERVQKWSGENNGHYNPNKDIEYTEKFYNKKYRDYLLNRQSGKCFICNSKTNLCLHHVDEDKQNDSEENLIYVCRKCHMSVHVNTEKKLNFKMKVEQTMELLKTWNY